MYKDKWAHTQSVGPKSTLRLTRTLGPSLASLAQSSWSLLSNALRGQDCITTYFNCRQKEHIQRDCPYPNKDQNSGGLNDQTRRPKATGRVFTLTGAKASKSKDLIQGKCFTSGIPSLVLFDSGETYSFTSYLCVEKLKLSMSSLNKDLVVETPTNGFVLTSNVCLNCPVEIFGRTFFIDLE